MKYSFFFHYNKPASREQKKPVISVHYKDQCFLVENIVCNVPTKGKLNKRQPYFVMDRVYICDNCGLEIDRDFNASVNLEKYTVSSTEINAYGEVSSGSKCIRTKLTSMK
jgi:hypothetical protein